MKKLIYKQWWFWLVIGFIVILIYTSSLNNDTDKDIADRENSEINDNNPSDNQTDNNNEDNTDENDSVIPDTNGEQDGQNNDEANNKETNHEEQLEFTNIIIEESYDSSMVYGEVINHGEQRQSFTLKVSFYDEDDKLLGTAFGAVNDLNSGTTKIFTALATEDYSAAAKNKVQVDTIINTEENIEIPIEFSNIITKNTLGSLIIEGEAKNKGTKVHSFTLVGGIYDANGNLLGVASGAMNELVAGDTKTFTVMSAKEYPDAVEYKMQVDTLVE